MKNSGIYREVRSIMGVWVTIMCTHSNANEALEAMGLAFKAIQEIDDLMSIHKTSEVNLLNKNGFYNNANAHTIEVIKRGIYYSGLSEGIFDISVLPLLNLWKERLVTSAVPTESEVEETLKLVDSKDILIDGNNIRLRKAGMGITLEAVAKGYAVDRSIEALRSNKIKHALVDASGDIRVIGGGTNTRPWMIGVRNPQNRRHIITTVELCDKAIATSGTYQRCVNDLIYAKTGTFSQEILSSTIIADKAVNADALSTSVLVLGVEKGMKLAEDLNLAALIITNDGEILKSRFWTERYCSGISLQQN